MASATPGEWLAPLSLATDLGAALPQETAFRTALVAMRAAELWDVPVEPQDAYFGALLRHIGCTATAAAETRIMGDEHELRSSLALSDAASPASMFTAARRGFGRLTEVERESMRGHAAVTERSLRLSKPWQDLALLAASDHERQDGSGYPRLSPAPNIGVPARILAAADVLAALVTARPHRPAHPLAEATRLLQEQAAKGRLDRAAVDAVLASQGLRTKERPRLPAGLSERELEVLRLLARGLADKEIAVEPHYAAAGDYVYATLYHEYKVRKTGKVLALNNGVHRSKVKNGQVVEWFAADDTQLTVEALS